ncbi:MAG: EpsD family peptidyl-prolyl cis-trans isomerase [Zoogloeaceae bacterium]|nr:EpsD family peptidyl-prolyl cis-trans isomerase [Zoogloeaceae bacterium]
MASRCLGLMLLVGAAGCSPVGDTEVLARVNGTPILASEVDRALRVTRPPAGDDAGTARRQAVESLVVEELFAQQYLRAVPGSAHVDREAVKAARRDALAQRFIARLMEDVPRPTAEDIRSHYRAHPNLYARRQIFELRQVDIQAPAERAGAIRGQIASQPDVEALLAWLRAENLRFAMNLAELAAEDLPPPLATRLPSLRPGQVAVLPSPGGLLLIQLVGVRSAPLDITTAWPQVEAHLWAERQKAAVAAEFARLSKLAMISYTPQAPPAPGGPRAPGRGTWPTLPVLSKEAP